jgi:hypothetical protein
VDDGVSPNANAPSLRRAAHRLPAPMLAGSLEAGIRIGHTAEMPVFVFDDDNIANLLAYFETLRNEDLTVTRTLSELLHLLLPG